MSEAAETVEEVSQDETVEHVPGLDPDPELPDFDLFGDDLPEESQNETAEAKKEEPDVTWTARVKKDRQQRKKEIEFKKREHEIQAREEKVGSYEGIRDNFMKDPEGFLQNQGVDPMEFFSDWTNRIATGINSPSEDTRLSTTERQVRALTEELQKRDQEKVEKSKVVYQQEAINQYYGQIDNFMKSTDNYPLTKEQCTPQDIAQGIAAYHQETGVELGFNEAFKMVEDGLTKKENDIFNNPTIIAKFKQFHGLDASNKKGRRSHLTLSNTLETQPTKTPAEDMTDDEIHEFWKGKLFT